MRGKTTKSPIPAICPTDFKTDDFIRKDMDLKLPIFFLFFSTALLEVYQIWVK